MFIVVKPNIAQKRANRKHGVTVTDGGVSSATNTVRKLQILQLPPLVPP